ncbi:MotE family protein [Brevibacillus sp. GCM10020057]|uniref:MotE family protein n=1 Tax=Brevibacillus sp. GCM10020057 TaxID=3317327 RepID=UPI00363A1C2B
MEEIQEEREYGRWEWFFYMIVIPALFASLLGGVLLSLLGVNVLGNVLHWASTVPYVEKLVPDKYAAAPGSDPKEELTKQVSTLQNEHLKSQQALSSLKDETAKKDSTIQALEKQVEDLKKQLEDKRTSEEERQQQFADLAKVYTTMSPKNAAAIIENLSLEESVAVMTKMKPNQRADILAKMDPKKAADISIMLKDSVVNKDDDIAALQQRLQVLTNALSENRNGLSGTGGTKESLINSFAQMPPADSAAVIRSLMLTNKAQAISILSAMPEDKRALTLAAIAEEDKKKDDNMAARITEALLR